MKDVLDMVGKLIRRVVCIMAAVAATAILSAQLSSVSAQSQSIATGGASSNAQAPVGNTSKAASACTSGQCPGGAATDERLSVWEAMNNALLAGDVNTALTYLTESAKLKYQPVFQALLSQMPSIIASYSRPVLSFDGLNFAEYFVSRPAQPGSDERVIYAIQFVRDRDGNWKIDSM